MEKVKGKLTTYTKRYAVECQSFAQISEVSSGTALLSNQVEGRAEWQHSWATFTGDARALSSSQRDLTQRKEAHPARNDLAERARQNLLNNLSSELSLFFDRY